ncbi:MAG: oxidoreductase, partial [Desulfobacterales bacterium]|nr:oxidoreductase [Desulfobacterales bacterium]
MKISIRWVIIIGCFALVWGTHLIIAPFSFFTTQRVMLDHTRDIMENILELTLKETENYFSVARGAAHLTKRLISSEVVNTEQGNIDKLEQYFFDQLQIYPQFAGIYFADPKGNFYYVNRDASTSREWFRTKIIEMGETGRATRLLWRDRNMDIVRESIDPNDTYDPRVRPWFKKAVETRNIIWTDPYVFFTSQKPGITTAGPVYGPDGSLTGVVGVDIELDVLSRFIGSLRVGKTGLAFMINQDQDVIAFHDLDQLKKTREDAGGRSRLAKLHELDNPVCALAFRAAGA